MGCKGSRVRIPPPRPIESKSYEKPPSGGFLLVSVLVPVFAVVWNRNGWHRLDKMSSFGARRRVRTDTLTLRVIRRTYAARRHTPARCCPAPSAVAVALRLWRWFGERSRFEVGGLRASHAFANFTPLNRKSGLGFGRQKWGGTSEKTAASLMTQNRPGALTFGWRKSRIWAGVLDSTY
jgi:hypothetical protein